MFKKIAVALMTLSFISLTAVPDAFAGPHRHRRNRVASHQAAHYGGGQYRAYYGAQPYYGAPYGHQTSVRRGYSGPYRGYAAPYHGHRRRSSTGRVILTTVVPAAAGAGVGALVGGKKGALIGALLGGGGGVAYNLIKRRNRHR